MKKFLIVAGLVMVGYAGYEQLLAPRAKGGTRESGGPVLRMKPEALANLQLMAPSKVVMFGTSWCGYCAKARALFNAQGVRFIELDLEKDGAAEAFQRDVMGLRGFPTIVIGNRVIQGFDEGQILASLKEL